MNHRMRCDVAALVLREAQHARRLPVNIHLREHLEEERPVRGHGVIRPLDAAEERIVPLPHDIIERRDLMVGNRELNLAVAARKINGHARVQELAPVLRHLRDARDGVNLARAQAREIFLPAAGHERDIHARIARERLHVVRLDAVVVACRIDGDDAVTERPDADAQRVARLSERRKTCQQRQT